MQKRSIWSRGSRPSALLLLVVWFALPRAAGAQATQVPDDRPRVAGVVAREGTYEPVEGAVVWIAGLDLETRTGPMGDFSFADVPSGDLWIRVAAPGHPMVADNVVLRQDRTVFVQFLLPTVADVLSELLVGVDQGRQGAQSAADIVALQVPSLAARNTDVSRSGNSTAIRLRGVSSIVQSSAPVVYLDGVLIAAEDVFNLLSDIPASQVESVEVLRGPASAFLYPNAANGVIVVKTRR